jgi:alpha-ketoglutarate-dependent taurine dioxygenase
MADRFVPLTPRIGARVGASKAELLDPAFGSECMHALEHFGVLVFPEVGFGDAEQVAFSRNLGEIIPTGPPGPDGNPEYVFKVSLDRSESRAADYLRSTIGWHMDGLHDGGPPPKATLLSARRLPEQGSQTEFCSTYAAYDDLSDEERRQCESLRAVHCLGTPERGSNPLARPVAHFRQTQRRSTTEHPVVWQHQSGRRSVVLGMSMDYIIGIREDASRELIERLSAVATRRDNVYRHEWQVGDLVMWDNCGVMHRAMPYAEDSGRLMHRTGLYGFERITGVEA